MICLIWTVYIRTTQTHWISLHFFCWPSSSVFLAYILSHSKICMTSLSPQFKNSSWQNRYIQFKGWCTWFLFCKYLLHISAGRPYVQSRDLHVMPQTISWLFPFAIFKFILQLLTFLIMRFCREVSGLRLYLVKQAHNWLFILREITPCTVVHKFRLSEKFSATIFKEEFIVKYM